MIDWNFERLLKFLLYRMRILFEYCHKHVVTNIVEWNDWFICSNLLVNA